jgi:nucleoside-triphosphatase THEP1
MATKIIIVGNPSSGRSQLLQTIFMELKNLLRIHGFIIDKLYDIGQITSANIIFLRNPESFVTLDFKDKPASKESYDSFTELALTELSLFPSPDLFLIDDLGIGFISSPRIQQQLRTISLSRIPCIFTASESDLEHVRNIIGDIRTEIIRINAYSGEDLYLDILNRIS